MSFTAEEVTYIRSQPLARVATVASNGQPDVVPVRFEFDGEHFYIDGFAPARARRTHNVKAGNDKVALVIDDLVSVAPWTPRFLRVYGTGEIIEGDPAFGGRPVLKITPAISWSANLAGRPITEPRDGIPRRTVHEAG